MRGATARSGRWARSGWRPGWHRLRGYRRQDLARDVTAGLVLTALLVPAGMGYADVARLPVETGLYATVAAPWLVPRVCWSWGLTLHWRR